MSDDKLSTPEIQPPVIHNHITVNPTPVNIPPPVVNNPIQDDTETKRANKIAEWSTWINTILLTLTLVGVYLTWKSIDISKDAVKQSAKEFDLTHRPYLLIDSVKGVSIDEGRMIYQYRLNNIIDIPAKIVGVKVYGELVTKKDFELNLDSLKIFPNQFDLLKEKPHTERNYVRFKTKIDLIDSNYTEVRANLYIKYYYISTLNYQLYSYTSKFTASDSWNQYMENGSILGLELNSNLNKKEKIVPKELTQIVADLSEDD